MSRKHSRSRARVKKSYSEQRRKLRKRIQTEAGGCYCTGIVRVDLSDPELRDYTRNWCVQVIRQIDEGGPTARCIGCDAELPPGKPGAFFVMAPMRYNATVSAVLPFCASCATKFNDVELNEIANAWMDRKYPGSRSIPAHQIGPIGRA